MVKIVKDGDYDPEDQDYYFFSLIIIIKYSC